MEHISIYSPIQNKHQKFAKMVTSSAMPEKGYHVRSISMPSQLHPCAERIEEELIKLRNLEAATTSSTSLGKAEDICNGLSGLGNLYSLAEDLLRLPLMQQVFIDKEQEERLNEVLDGSVRLLDMCSTTRDILFSMKEQVQNLQSALRRRKAGESLLLNEVQAYICFRKHMKKDLAKCLIKMKNMYTKSASSGLLNQDHHLARVIQVLRESTSITVSIFQSLLKFVCVPRRNTNKGPWSFVSKVGKGQVACEGLHAEANVVASADDALYSLYQNTSSKDDIETMQRAQKGFVALGYSIESIDAGLECLFRHLIQTRVSLLNILTH